MVQRYPLPAETDFFPDGGSARLAGPGSVFAVFWALAGIVHLVNQSGADLEPIAWVNLAVATWVIARPRSAHVLAALALIQVIETLVQLPDTPDHQLLVATVNVGILGCYTGFREARTSTDRLVAHVSPTGRWVLLIAYSAAALAKYNTDFLTLESSCAAYIAEVSTFGLSPRDTWAAHGFVVLTLLGETLVPLLLLTRVTRRWGVLFAVTFHFLVSLSPAVSVGDFTATLWPLFLLFLPENDLERLGRRASNEWSASATVRFLRRWLPWPLCAILFGVVLMAASGMAAFVPLGVWLTTTLVGLWLIAHLWAVLRNSKDPVMPIGWPAANSFLAVALIVLLVVGPYLGFGTSSRFTMFSGLRTEGAGTNHLFLPSLHLVNSQSRALIVLADNGRSRALSQASTASAAIPVVQLRQHLADRSVAATFETLDGRRIEVVAGDNHPLRRPAPWWQRKTQHYRAFKIDGRTDPTYCSN